MIPWKVIPLGNRIKKPITKALIAACGMNCGICSNYLAYVNNFKRSQCKGCRPRNQRCTYLFGKCTGINKTAKSSAAFCFECNQYPCKQINRMDDRYRSNYGMSPKNNLDFIQKNGVDMFIQEQYKKYQCSKCNEMISIHNRKCFKCDTITKLVEQHKM